MKKIAPIPSSSIIKDPRSYTFLGVILLLITHHLFAYFGHYGYDDIMGYAYYGKKWADGNLFFLNDDFFSYRWGFISFTGFFYALFGMSDSVSAITPSLVFLITVLLLFRATKNYNPWVGCLAAIIYSLDNWTLFYADKLMPDTSVALCAFGALLLLQEYRYTNHNKPIAYALAISSVLLMGFLCKQTILLLFPVFFYFFLLDIVQRKHLKFWLTTTLSCIILGSLYLGFIYALTGDPMMRFRVAEAGHAANLGRSFAHCNYAAQSWSALLNRISFGFITLLFANGLMLSIILAMGASLGKKWKSVLTAVTQEHYWILVLALSFLASNLMTTSYKAYQPMCLDIRHFLYLVPIAAVVAAPRLYQFIQHKSFSVSFLFATWLGTGMSFFFVDATMFLSYLGVSLSLTLCFLFPSQKGFKLIAIFGLVASLAFANKTNITEATKNGYTTQRKAVYQLFKHTTTPTIVFTDPIERNFAQYLLEFDTTSLTKFYTYDAIDTLHIPSNTAVFVLVNGYTQYMSHVPYETLPQAIRSTFEGNTPPQIEILLRQAPVDIFRVYEPNILKE